MRNFTLIFKHYFKRSMLEPVGMLVLTALPMALIAILSLVYNNIMKQDDVEVMVNGYNMLSTQIAVIMLIMFQFFGGNVMLDWLYADFKGGRRWRLYAAPISQNAYIIPAAFACWIYSVVQGALIITVSAVFLDVYWGNYAVLAAVLLLVSAIGQFMFMLLFLFTKTKGAAEGIAQCIIWGMAMTSGNFWAFNEGEIADFLKNIPQPMALAPKIINDSGFIGNNMTESLIGLAILAGITAILGIAVVLVGRRRKF